nr:hypothetical protein CTRU02_14218 [Colletotrichum truncatum]
MVGKVLGTSTILHFMKVTWPLQR